jgi:hypothetical protein
MPQHHWPVKKNVVRSGSSKRTKPLSKHSDYTALICAVQGGHSTVIVCKLEFDGSHIARKITLKEALGKKRLV